MRLFKWFSSLTKFQSECEVVKCINILDLFYRLAYIEVVCEDEREVRKLQKYVRESDVALKNFDMKNRYLVILKKFIDLKHFRIVLNSEMLIYTYAESEDDAISKVLRGLQ